MRSRKTDVITFAISARGPDAILDHVQALRQMHRDDRDAFNEIKMQLWLEGMEVDEIMDLVSLSGRHDDDCVCWRCIERTLAALRRCEVRMKVDIEMKRTVPTEWPPGHGEGGR